MTEKQKTRIDRLLVIRQSGVKGELADTLAASYARILVKVCDAFLLYIAKTENDKKEVEEYVKRKSRELEEKYP